MLFREILYADSKMEIDELGKALGPRLMKEILQFWYRRVSVGTFVEYVGLVSKHSGLARCDVDQDGDECTLTYRHQLGERWSRFISTFYGEALRKLFSLDPKTDLGSNQVVIKWKA